MNLSVPIGTKFVCDNGSVLDCFLQSIIVLLKTQIKHKFRKSTCIFLR